ncbi:MAG: hypothetical protein ABFS56_26220 [Pseudomonadota bacterium]
MIPENIYASENTYHLRRKSRCSGHSAPLEVYFYDLDPNIASCFLQDIAFYLENPTYRLIYDFCTNKNIELPLNSGDSHLIPIDEERAICYMGLGSYLLGYLHPEVRTQDKVLFPQIAVRTREVQGADILATFDYGKWYYLLLDVEKRPTGETNEMMFEGIVVNPQKYMEFQSSVIAGC